MSYILEALKKADAAREREREAVPGLHSRHDHALPDETDERAEASAPTRTPWLVGGIAGGVVIAGALFWLLGRSGPDAPMAPETRPTPMHGQVGDVGEAPPSPGATAPMPLPTQAPSGMAAAPTTPVAPVTPAPGPSANMSTAPATQVQPPANALPAPARTPPAQAARQAPPQQAGNVAPPTSTATSPSTAPAPTATSRATPAAQDPLRVDPSLREAGPKVVPMQDLPDNIRRELPQLTVGGAMHSDVAANRMLVLNGGVFREGDQPAPGVVLEEIRLKSAVLRYKGYRYRINY